MTGVVAIPNRLAPAPSSLKSAGASHGPRTGLMLLLVLTLLVSLGCGSVREADLVGRWTLKDQARTYLPANVRVAAGQLELAGDGSFTAVELPERRAGTSEGYTKSGRGVWTVTKVGGADKVQLNFDDFTTFFDISSFLGSQLTLYYYVDDPDSAHRIEFVRGS